MKFLITYQGMMPKVLDQGLPKMTGPSMPITTWNVYTCNTELIIGGDIDIEEDMNGYPEFSVMTDLSCPKCFAEVEVLKKRDAYD